MGILLNLIDKNLEKHLINLEIIRDRLSWLSSCANNKVPHALMWKNIMIKREKETMNSFKEALRKVISKKYPGARAKLNNKVVQDLSSKLRIRREMTEKNAQINQIKWDLLEASAKICMNPTRIMRLLEEEVISLDDIETLYDI